MQRFSGAELRRLREQAGKTRTQLGAQIGRSEQTIIGYERGMTVPSMYALGAIATALGCEPGAVFVDTDDTSAQPAARVRSRRQVPA